MSAGCFECRPPASLRRQHQRTRLRGSPGPGSLPGCDDCPKVSARAEGRGGHRPGRRFSLDGGSGRRARGPRTLHRGPGGSTCRSFAQPQPKPGQGCLRLLPNRPSPQTSGWYHRGKASRCPLCRLPQAAGERGRSKRAAGHHEGGQSWEAGWAAAVRRWASRRAAWGELPRARAA